MEDSSFVVWGIMDCFIIAHSAPDSKTKYGCLYENAGMFPLKSPSVSAIIEQAAGCLFRAV